MIELLCCPVDERALKQQGPEHLRCELGHVFPVVEGVPVLLRADVLETIGLAGMSLRRAAGEAQVIDRRAPHLFLESLGVSDEEKERAVALERAPHRVDPVVSVLVAATNGNLYRGRVGKLERYPLPTLRLPPGDGRLLDVGCSWGRWSIAAARLGYRVIGIDPSLAAVMAARRVCRELGLEASFVVGDARFLPFRPAAFERVFSYSVLQHFSRADAALALSEVGRVLRPGGESLIQMPNRLGLRNVQQQARRRFREGSGFEVRYWSPSELVVAFDRAIGPSVLEVDGFFGLGIQASDREMLALLGRAVVSASEALRRLEGSVRALRLVADSLYVRSAKSLTVHPDEKPPLPSNGRQCGDVREPVDTV